MFTIWDAGGNDTLDLSGFFTPSRIDLHQGGFSDAGQLSDNISIAYGAVIENAIAGPSSDVLVANETRNLLTGGGSPDIFTFTERDAQAGWTRSDGKKLQPDLITDFASGVDRIDLSQIDAVRGTAADEAFAFIGSAAFSNQPGQLRAELAGGRIRIEGDTDGDGLANLAILTSSVTILASDFVL